MTNAVTYLQLAVYETSNAAVGEQPADQTALAKLLTNPDTADLLKQLMTAMGK